MTNTETTPRRWVPVDLLLRLLAEEDTDTAARWGDQGGHRIPRPPQRTAPPVRP